MSSKLRPTANMSTPDNSPSWSQDARTHFEQTGTYRTQDLQRVLGDPRAHTQVPIKADSASNCWKPKA